jgi:hypothetical protein
MVESPAFGIGLGGLGDDGRARRSASSVEGAGVVEAVALGQEEPPVDVPEHRPDRHRPKVHALLAKSGRALPGFGEPAQLLVPVAPVVDLGDRDGNAVAVPGLPKPRRQPGFRLEPLHPYRLGVDIGVAPVSARLEPGV